MDIVNRRWSELGNKILAELRNISGSIKQGIDRASEDDRTSQQQDRPTPEVRAILNAPHGIETKQSREDAEQEGRYQRKTLVVQWILCFATIGAFGAAAYYACYAKRQWVTMNQTYAEIQKQTPLVKQAADAATSAAQTAAITLDDSRQDFRIEQRPYVIVDLLRLTDVPKVNERISAKVNLRNAGKTPAFSAKCWREIGVLTGRPEQIPINARSWIDKADAQETAIYLASDTPFSEPVVTDSPVNDSAIVQAIATGDYTIYMLGAVTYKDAFGGHHWTVFCGYYNPGFNLTMWGCPKGGNATDIEKPQWKRAQ